MPKPVFVLADTDTQYILPLEVRLVEAFGDRIHLEVMDDPGYIERYFADEPQVDVLIADERICAALPAVRSIGTVFCLTENGAPAPDGAVTHLYKYANIQKLFSEIEYRTRRFVPQEPGSTKKTRIVAVYSPMGGAGTTAVALGLCVNLAANHKRVLFIAAEDLPDFAFYLSDQSALDPRAAAVIGGGRGELYNGLRPYLRREGFDYLPPLGMAASAMGVGPAAFGQVAEAFKERVDYDYIVMDTDLVFDQNKDRLLKLADKVVLLRREGELARYRMERLQENMAADDEKRFLTVVNHTSREGYAGRTGPGDGAADAEIPFLEGGVDLKALGRCDELERLCYLL